MDSSPTFYKCQYGCVELLTDHNYLMWSSVLPTLLKADGTWNIVQGTEKEPVEPRPQPPRGRARIEPLDNEAQAQYAKDLASYESKAAKACAMIFSSVSPTFQQFIYALTDPELMWTTLKTQLDSMSSSASPFIIQT